MEAPPLKLGWIVMMLLELYLLKGHFFPLLSFCLGKLWQGWGKILILPSVADG